MSDKQERTFYRFEGDRWFGRNQATLSEFDSSQDLPLRLIDLYQIRPKRVLEIGAANGFRLAEVARRFGSYAVGVEASLNAVKDGRRRFPSVHLHRGRASHLPVRDAFDLVIVNFVFHWIDRSLILSAVSETDHALAEAGFLILGDFSPTNRHRVPYHHLKDGSVQTFKQNYAEMFLASGLYRPVAFLTSAHSLKSLRGHVPESERVGAWLLEKRLTEHYVTVPPGRLSSNKVKRS